MSVSTLYPLLQTRGHHGGSKTRPRPTVEFEPVRTPYVPVKPERNPETGKCQHGVHWKHGDSANDIYCTMCSSRHIAHLLGEPDPRGKFSINKKHLSDGRIFAQSNYVRKSDCPRCHCPAHFSPEDAPTKWTCADCGYAWEGSAHAKLSDASVE
jgi:hypothetical protein